MVSETPLIVAGSLEVSGTFTGTFSGHGADTLTRLLGLTEPPRHHIRVHCPPDADRHCPVCLEPAEAVVLEDVTVISGGPAPRMGGGSSYWLAGLDPAAYACEPCGHRFDRDGTEIEHEA